MADLMQTGATWLAARLKASASQSVTYMRGSQAVGSSLTATIGRCIREQDQETGILLWVSQDFVFTAADLTLDGAVITPANGDRIAWNGYTYEVLGDVGTPSSTPSEGFRTMVRVHTKQVG